MHEVLMPKLGLTMEAGTVERWRKRPGDPVCEGETVCEISTEKITGEVQAPAAGTLGPILVAAGKEVPCLTVLTHVLAPGEDPPATSTPRTAVVVPGGAGGAARTPVPRSVSPRAARRARELGIDLATVVGSGPGGMVELKDVLGRVHSGEGGLAASPPGGERASPARLGTARSMMRARELSAPVTLMREVDVTALALLTTRGEHPGYTALFVWAAARALERHTDFLAQLDGEMIVRRPLTGIGVAVDTPAGLLVPVVRMEHLRDPWSAAGEIRRLAQLCRDGSVMPEQTRDGVFTVTNLGGLDIDGFTPIPVPGQAGILGIGRRRRTAGLVGDALGIVEVMTLSLTFDHRVVDGAEAARLLADICCQIREPTVPGRGETAGAGP